MQSFRCGIISHDADSPEKAFIWHCWSGTNGADYDTLINILERVQHRATKLIPSIGQLDYEDRLQICNLTTLEQRRERGDAIDAFKILAGRTKIDSEKLFSFASQRHDAYTRSVTNKLLVPEKCRLDLRKYFFPNRVVRIWNDLPLEIRESQSINEFKNGYDDWTTSCQEIWLQC